MKPFLLSLLAFAMTCLPALANKAEADKLAQQGNWKEALEAYERFIYAEDADASTVHESFGQAIVSLQRLNLIKRTDEICEKMVKAHPQNWRVLEAVANSYLTAQHYGVILNGESQRAITAAGAPTRAVPNATEFGPHSSTNRRSKRRPNSMLRTSPLDTPMRSPVAEAVWALGSSSR